MCNFYQLTANNSRILWSCAGDEKISQGEMDKKSHFWQSLARECPRKKNKSRQNWIRRRRWRRRRRRRVLLCGNIRQRELPPNRHCCSSAALLRSQIEQQTAASLLPPSPRPPRCLPRRTTSALVLFPKKFSVQCPLTMSQWEWDRSPYMPSQVRERERENRTFFFAYFYITHAPQQIYKYCLLRFVPFIFISSNHS